ncbi:hypothetical protein PO864_17890 [Providencia alcalifaciens]|uniref:Morphogenetic protein n=1 Tax=Providencia alcalifaciens 205/92 TaxID=1256988 RepID=A0AAV3M062_9GAMM|nr:hypothetical protein [Providencia alcalifaciens]EUD09183.1 hypothetical protein HMPREF1563_3329 [Providencia alcalifaciens 205/92]WGZ54081.1 hypothetical protein PO864_17890 [Providencia alcalifaciens]
MKERGIIFNTEMVRAIIDGRKTQTRCIAKFKPIDKALNFNFSGLRAGNYHAGIKDGRCVLRSTDGATWNDRTYPLTCPYGKVGDRIWVRETWQGPLVDVEKAYDLFKDPTPYQKVENCVYKADGGYAPEYIDCDDNFRQGWRPSTQMPRWASRITLEITDVHVERLQSISEEDAKAEGFDNSQSDAANSIGWFEKPIRAFRRAWGNIYGNDGWDSNPWVWVIEFKRV